MLKNSLISLVAVLIFSGCSKEPDPVYGEPLEQGDYDRQQLIDAHAARPVTVAGYGDVYVAAVDTQRKNCARCHKPGKELYRDESLPAGQDAHWDVAVHHAGDMDCFSCHIKEDPNRLISVVDNDATLDTAYLHCGSCHKDQLASWLGGAHGKRLTGWNGVRIVKNCTGCHNPHAPARETMLPVAQPVITPERAKRH